MNYQQRNIKNIWRWNTIQFTHKTPSITNNLVTKETGRAPRGLKQKTVKHVFVADKYFGWQINFEEKNWAGNYWKIYVSENYNLMFSIFKTLVFSFISNSGQWISKILLIKFLPDNFFLSRYDGRISYLMDGGYRCFNHTYTFIVAMFPLDWHFMVRTNTHVCTVSGRSSFCTKLPILRSNAFF